MKVTPGRIEFDSGAVMYFNAGIIGLSDELRVFGGYDDGGEDYDLTPQDRQELADHMIERWKQFATAPPPKREEEY